MDELTIEEFNRDLSNYILINNDYYRLLSSDPDRLNPTPVNKSHLTGRFGFTNRQLEEIPELEGFTCEPGHGAEYQRIFNNKYNQYHRVKWEPVEGQWPTIEKLIKHLYGANGVEPDQIEELYDYHTIMLKYPKQKLFGRVLYSLQQGTAKSALGYLERLMFEGNYTKLRDSELESDFNSVWVNSLLIHLDEPAFDRPKKMSRTIRDMITAESMNLRRMREEHVTVPFHAKILITTNDTDFMQFEQSDRRYWIREVGRIAKQDLDPEFNKKMEEEVQHYIHFLLNRKMKYSGAIDGTFWLPQSVLLTNGNKKLVGDNQSDEHRQLQEWFEGYFLDDKKRDHVYFTIKDLIDKVDWDGKPPSTVHCSRILRDGLKIEQPNKITRMKNGDNYITKTSESALKPGKFWRADRAQFNLEIDIFSDL